MKTRYFVFIAIVIIAFLSSCKKDKEDKEIKDIELSTKQQEIATAGNEFSLGLFQKIAETETEDNFMISPLSINFALAMTVNGAKNNTQSQMLASMGFTNFEMEEFNQYFGFVMDELVNLDSDVSLNIANSIWYRNGFTILPAFLNVNQQYYDAQIAGLDFSSPEAVSTINNWVSNATNDKIPTIIDAIGGDVVMYLINAVYFNGKWKYEFDPAQTQKRDFYVSSAQTVEVDMMEMQSKIKYFYDPELQIAEIPYGNGNFVMDILVPASDKTPQDVIANLSPARWQGLTQGLYNQDVVLSMPKFKFDFEKNLVSCLQALGMTDMFIDGVADFSGIDGLGGLFVSAVKHKTYIDVNEEGTEAAAVTSVEFAVTSVNPDGPIYLFANKPFVFVIRETSTGIILFTGVVKNPTLE